MTKKKLTIVFMGTPDFAVPSLEILIQHNYTVAAVITAPDKPSGRGLKMTASPVKEVALRHNIPVLQPTNLKSPEFMEELKSYNANLQVVVAFRMLPEVVWAMPEYGTFNLHASLLPQYRGAAPINWAIMNGETETGVTTFFLKQEIDTGNIVFQDTEPIHDTDTAGALYERLMYKGAQLVLRTVQAIEAGNYPQLPQPAGQVLKPAPKIFKETCEINWQQPIRNIYNFIRGLSPYPAAWTMLNGKFYKIYAAHPIEQADDSDVGAYRTDEKSFLHIKALDGWLAIDELQAEGKKRMTITEFLRGNRFG